MSAVFLRLRTAGMTISALIGARSHRNLLILGLMQMTPARWEYTCRYMHEVFGSEDAVLRTLMSEASAAGLPDIAISADVGRLLKMLASLTRGRLALEVGTLGGYSAIWLARGLAPTGSLITIESEPLHVQFAKRQFERAGLQHRIQVRQGAALHVLPQLARELQPHSVDVVFLDAVKTEYPEYWRHVRSLISPGGLIIADNALGANSWWIDEAGNSSRDAADQFNRLVAQDADFEAVAIPMRQGLLIGRRINTNL